MARYADECEALIDAAGELRRQIALRLAEEAGDATAPMPDEAQLAAADAAIMAWAEHGAEEQDEAAFRPIGPLQRLLSEHARLVERIDDWMDRRLS